jgi:hypothetical protein
LISKAWHALLDTKALYMPLPATSIMQHTRSLGALHASQASTQTRSVRPITPHASFALRGLPLEDLLMWPA